MSARPGTGKLPRGPAAQCRVGIMGLCAALCFLLHIPVVRAQSEDVTVALTSPGQGQEVTGRVVEIRGTASGPGFQRYDLYYRPARDDVEYIYFDGGQTAVTSDILGHWISDGQEPGDYQILLQVVLADQQQAVETSVRFTLTAGAAAAVPDTADTGNGGPANAEAVRAETAQALRQAMDQLALRVRPQALWAYIQRGMRFSAIMTAVVLGYFALKALAAMLFRQPAGRRGR